MSLNEKETAEALIRALFLIAWADKKLTQEESDWLRDYCAHRTGMPREMVAQLTATAPSEDEVLKKLRAIPTGLVIEMIKEAYQLMWADGEEHPSERDLICKFGEIAGVDLKRFGDLLKWLAACVENDRLAASLFFTKMEG